MDRASIPGAEEQDVAATYAAESGGFWAPFTRAITPGLGPLPLEVDCESGRLEIRAQGAVWPFQRR